MIRPRGYAAEARLLRLDHGSLAPKCFFSCWIFSKHPPLVLGTSPRPAREDIRTHGFAFLLPWILGIYSYSSIHPKMDPIPTQFNLDGEIAEDLRPLLVVYKDGRVHRFMDTSTVPPSSDFAAIVQSKDVQISPELSARLYLPKSANNKLPLLIYFHGGAFVIGSAKSPTYHNNLNRVAAETSAVIVSVDYRLAPEHPLPIAFDDSWSTVLWSLSLSDPWLSEYADLNRVFFAGDSAGATIAHHMAIRLGKSGLEGSNLVGLVLIHPYFLNKDEAEPNASPKTLEAREFGNRFWRYLCPGESGMDHPWINPAVNGSLAEVAAKKIMVFVAEEDFLRDRGIWYAKLVRESEWPGEVHVVEHEGVGHVFHLFTPDNPKSEEMMKQLVEFMNED